MGIKGLHKLLSEHAPKATKSCDIKNFGGRKVAIDASMSLYQFIIAVRQTDGHQLMNNGGEITSHLMGMFYRTLRLIDNGIKPVYVFDGKPPVLKNGELAKRSARREEAMRRIEEIKDTDAEKAARIEKQLVHVTKEQNEEAKRLLRLMGIPIIEAPSEAEAQCAALAKSGKVFASASEDMDTLCFGTPFLLRHLTFSEAKKIPILEVSYSKSLEGLQMDHNTFVDLCILLGCDYTSTIKGIGPTTALKLIREHGSLEKIIKHIEETDTNKYKIPQDWPYKEVRELLINPEIKDPNECELKWTEPDVEGLVKFLVEEKNFSEERVRAGAARLLKNLKVKPQARLDGFFKVLSKPTEVKNSANKKRRFDSKNAENIKKSKK